MLEMFVDGELQPTVYIMVAVFTLVNLLFWFGGLPYLMLKIGRPKSRRKFFLFMTLYTLIVLGLHVFYLYLSCLYENGYSANGYTANLGDAFYILFAAEFVLFLAAGIISFNFFKHTNIADVVPPAEYRHIKPVKAKVTSIDEKTVVEYNGKEYILSKNFKFRLRDNVKVRLIEGRENCYLA